MNGFYSDHALVKIVRLTIESNLLTSKYPLDVLRANLQSFHALFSFCGNRLASSGYHISRESLTDYHRLRS